MFSKTAAFRHDSIPQGIAAIQALGTANGFTVDATEDATQFTDANLAQYDVVVFLSTTGDVLNDAQQTAFERYIQAGGGYVGIHAASDTEYTWPWYGQMLGGYFRNHPAGTPHGDGPHRGRRRALHDRPPGPAGCALTSGTTSSTPANPVVGGNQPGIATTARARAGVKVLATVDESTYDEADDSAAADDHPIAWCTNYDGGRAWYTAMGHTQASFSEPEFRAHLLGGLRTAAGTVAADCGAQRQAPPTRRATSRSPRSTTTPRARWSSPSPRTAARSTSSASPASSTSSRPTATVVTAGRTIPVSSVPGERPPRHRAGPELRRPTTTSTWPTRRCRTPRRRSASSRFTLNGDVLDLASEQHHLHVQHAAHGVLPHLAARSPSAPTATSTCATGDNTNPFASDGFDPIDERPGRAVLGRPAHVGQHQHLQRQDPAHHARSPTRPAPGVGTGYTIPNGNLFPEAEDTTNKTLPEIYAMGFRNPFRIDDRPEVGQGADGRLRPGRRLDEPEPRPAGQRRVQRRHARLLRLALLHPRQRPVQRLQLRDRRRPGRSSTARRRSTTRPTTRA